MPTKCCVPGCTGQGGFKFPKNAERRKKWLTAIKRTNFQPNKYSTVCALHFTEEDISKLSHYGVPYTNTILVRNAVPSEFPWTKKRARRERAVASCPTNGEVVTISVEPSAILIEKPAIEGSSAAASTEHLPDRENQTSRSTQTCNTFFSVNLFPNDSESLHHFTGLENYEKFLYVFNTLGNAMDKLVYRHFQVVGMSYEDQFFLTTVKLRRHTSDMELGHLFGVSERFAANVWMTWLGLMYAQWGELGMWPDKDMVEFFSPYQFKDRFPATRLMVEAFKPDDLTATVSIPATVYCDGKLKPSEIRRDKKIANNRARVERIFGVKQTFRILREPMDSNEAQLLTRIVNVCFMLYNFRAPAVNGNT